MRKDMSQMSQDELREEVLRLRAKMRDDALTCAREIEESRKAYEKNQPDSSKSLLGR